MIHTLTLTSAELIALDIILDFYVRLGLGQLSEIGTRLRLLMPVSDETTNHLKTLEESLFKDERPWKIEDKHTSVNTILAFAIQAKLQGDMQGLEWAYKRLRELRGKP